MALYDRIGHGYDVTRRADPGIVARLLALGQWRPGQRILDLGCGSGNYTVALAASGLRLVGLDCAAAMLGVARSKAPQVDWVQGEVEALPFANAAFDGLLATLTIHHWSALVPAFKEAFRVLGGSRLVLFTTTTEQTRHYWLNAYFPKTMERSIEQMPNLDRVAVGLHSAGFQAVRTEAFAVRPDLQDLFLYGGKQRPALYLDPRVRAGLSTFATLADPAEVQAGCEQLARDIDSGRIDEVIASYQHDGGDYLFVVAER